MLFGFLDEGFQDFSIFFGFLDIFFGFVDKGFKDFSSFFWYLSMNALRIS